MNKIAANILAIALMGASPFASAAVCDHVRALAAGTGVGAAVTASTFAVMTAKVTIIAIAGTTAAAGGLVAYCLVTSDEQG